MATLTAPTLNPAPAKNTWRRFVRAIGACYGRRGITNDEADFILWEYTAFPLASVEETRHQTAEFFRGVHRCIRCGRVERKADAGRSDRLCGPCRREV